VRLEADEHALLKAVSGVTDTTIQGLIEPVLLKWLDEYRDDPDVRSLLEARRRRTPRNP